MKSEMERKEGRTKIFKRGRVQKEDKREKQQRLGYNENQNRSLRAGLDDL